MGASELTVVPARVEHALALAPRIRLEEREEVRALLGADPLKGLLRSLQGSEVACTALLDGQPVSMFGAATLFERVAGAWMLSSCDIEHCPVSFIKVCLEWAGRFLERWEFLINLIDADYERSQRWARWMGARLLAGQVVDGHSFVWAELNREDFRRRHDSRNHSRGNRPDGSTWGIDLRSLPATPGERCGGSNS